MMTLLKKNTTLALMIAMVLTLAACDSGPDKPEDPAAESASAELGPEQVSTRLPANKYAEYEIVTLLPRDAIRAIDDPEFLYVSEADELYDPGELVLGVEFNGEARAYSVPLLSRHEIVNDTVGGVKIAATW